jgi:serine-type D-Ala-D-Ala carboxypeptidase/endopeptidase
VACRKPRTSGDETLGATIAASVERVARRHVGVAVGALVDDRCATVGMGHIEAGGRAVDGETSFQIGSITKVFTALILADAVCRGEVTLDQPLGSLVPAVANHPKGSPITLGDLASHTSGLPRLPPGLWRQALRNRHDPYAAFTRRQLIEALGRPPRRPAGRRVRYSNYGAGVLGEALSRALGASYGELVAHRIAGPLGMRRTDTHPPVGGENVAQGHNRRGKPVPDWNLPALEGAGALRSTCADLTTLLDVHLRPDGSPVADAVRLATEPRRRVRGSLDIALGWHILRRKHRPPLWWHNGGTGGFFSFTAFDLDTVTAIVVLTNTARSVDRLGIHLMDEIGTPT